VGTTSMKDLSGVGCPKLDRPEVSHYLFYPRASRQNPVSVEGVRDVLIPVEPDVSIGARFHVVDRQGASILFFHGNGEIVEDYEDIASLYSRLNLNFLPVDYRGYGHSTGRPSVSAMLRDAHVVFDYTRKWMTLNGCFGPFLVMGRSLGSASALELAESYPDDIDGLIIESGFAHSQTLLNLVGIDMKRSGITESEAFRHIEKIGQFERPTLVIHAEFDNVLPFTDGEDLYRASRSGTKKLLQIRDADHNSIFMVGISEYMKAIQDFVAEILALRRRT
jgi:pimeloyl-ACP methyl ester carboxylesterase